MLLHTTCGILGAPCVDGAILRSVDDLVDCDELVSLNRCTDFTLLLVCRLDFTVVLGANTKVLQASRRFIGVNKSFWYLGTHFITMRACDINVVFYVIRTLFSTTFDCIALREIGVFLHISTWHNSKSWSKSWMSPKVIAGKRQAASEIHLFIYPSSLSSKLRLSTCVRPNHQLRSTSKRMGSTIHFNTVEIIDVAKTTDPTVAETLHLVFRQPTANGWGGLNADKFCISKTGISTPLTLFVDSAPVLSTAFAY